MREALRTTLADTSYGIIASIFFPFVIFYHLIFYIILFIGDRREFRIIVLTPGAIDIMVSVIGYTLLGDKLLFLGDRLLFLERGWLL